MVDQGRVGRIAGDEGQGGQPFRQEIGQRVPGVGGGDGGAVQVFLIDGPLGDAEIDHRHDAGREIYERGGRGLPRRTGQEGWLRGPGCFLLEVHGNQDLRQARVQSVRLNDDHRPQLGRQAVRVGENGKRHVTAFQGTSSRRRNCRRHPYLGNPNPERRLPGGIGFPCPRPGS